MTEQNNPNQEEMLHSTEVNDNEKMAISVPIQEDIQTSEPASFEFAGFWMRFWAYLADLLIIGSLNRILIHPIFTLTNQGDSYSFLSGEVICTTIVFYLYFVLMTKFFRQTLGKMIFGLQVVALKEEHMTWGTLLFRECIGRFISKFTVVGYLIVGLLPRKQGLHDIFADTSVVLVKR
ncbi:RDD family protein [Peribacillus asahii]|uniref:RDD family protein n=1 Tax=Peribacillus asahii TaxID=228899 RepID=UPI00207A98AB|nr:RDD family protein [Peribacillus asahii]USK69510.1 RDD family protein [Peribacillus asahii]